MKSSTYSSQLASILNLPTCNNLQVSLSYNFYENDESLSEGIPPSESSYFTEVQRKQKSSRYNTLNFSVPQNVNRKSVSFVNEVKKNIEKIYSIEDISTTNLTSMQIQDTSISERIYQTILRSATLRGISGNMTDVSMQLGLSLGESIDRELLQDLSTSYAQSGAQFISDRKNLKHVKFSAAKSKPTFLTVNDKFLASATSSPENQFFAGPSAAISLMNRDADVIQANARSSTPAVGSIDFMTFLDPISIKPSSSSEFIRGIEIASILVYRKELLPNGSNETKLLDVLSPDSSSYIDFRIKIGSQYSYWTHCVYCVSSNVLSEDTSQVLSADFLFQSPPSEVVTSFCIVDSPPDPPSDFFARWNYQDASLVLSWNFPVNRRQDVKYFQVFRRKSIDEPFELLVEYDFNDSLKSPTRGEQIIQSLSKKISYPQTSYIDVEFNRDSKFIYSVACVDARGMVSNYSQQFEIAFDRVRNKLLTKQISPSGAPRQYPNVFLQQSFFKDTISTSKKRRIKVYFDPDYLSLKSKNGNEITAVLDKETGKYGINIFDVTRGQALPLHIQINNLLKTLKS